MNPLGIRRIPATAEQNSRAAAATILRHTVSARQCRFPAFSQPAAATISTGRMSCSRNEATHPRGSVEGYPEGPGKASYKLAGRGHHSEADQDAAAHDFHRDRVTPANGDTLGPSSIRRSRRPAVSCP